MSSSNRKRNRKPNKRRRKTKSSAKRKEVFKGIPYSTTNHVILGAGLVSIVVGFLILSTGNAVISTILLVIGYVILIPISLLLTFKKGKQEESKEPVEPPIKEAKGEAGV